MKKKINQRLEIFFIRSIEIFSIVIRLIKTYRWFQADVPSDEVPSFRFGREGQVHPLIGHRRRG